MATKTAIMPFVLSPKECAEYIGISENTIRSLCKEGKIKAARSGQNWKIPRPCAEAYIMEMAETGKKIEVTVPIYDETGGAE